MNLLMINPNCSDSVTALLQRHIAARLESDVQLSCVTARLGARYIADECSFALAGPAALDAYAEHALAHDAPDSVLVGCFGDPGVWALRELSGRPVTGLAEAAMRQAAALGSFAIVTGGAAWAPMLARLAASLGLGDRLLGVHTVAPSGVELAADPAAAIALLQSVCVRAAVGARSVVLGGAGLAGMAAQIRPALDVPLIDSVTAGTQAAVAAGWVALASPEAATAAKPVERRAPNAAPAQWQGVSTALQRLLESRFRE